MVFGRCLTNPDKPTPADLTRFHCARVPNAPALTCFNMSDCYFGCAKCATIEVREAAHYGNGLREVSDQTGQAYTRKPH